MKTVLAGFLLFFYILSSAQDFRLGVVLDPSITWLASDSKLVEGDGARAGLHYGISLDRFFAEKYALTTGFFMWNTGGKLLYKEAFDMNLDGTVTPLTPGTSVTYRLQYIDIPLGIKLMTTRIGFLTYFFQTGLNTMVNIKSKADIRVPEFNKVNIAKEVNFFNFGYHVGAGAEYGIGGNTALTFGLMYRHGFRDVMNRQKNTKVKINSLGLRVGILF